MGNENMLKPVVAILCLVYNHEKYLRDCLNGFVMQKTDFPFVAIVHDDASTDNSAEIIKEYAAKYPDIIKPIFETENQYNKNDGSLNRILYEESSKFDPDYIAFCEGDDYWTNPNKLQIQVETLKTYPECSICTAKVRLIDKEGNNTGDYIPSAKLNFKERTNLDDFMKIQIYYGEWSFHMSSIMIVPQVFKKYLELRKSIFNTMPYGDLPLLFSAFNLGEGIFLNLETGIYRTLSGGYSSKMLKNPYRNIENEKGLINSMINLDKYTKGKYNKFIKIRILRGRFKIEKLSKNFNKLLSWKFLPLYKLWGFKNSFFILLNLFAPSVYWELLKFKQNLKSK